MAQSRYIPSIDGIRALAVLSVIAFHFGVPGFAGGFVGVDVFFVISGFVIFRSIASEYRKTGSFSWKKFSLRRVRRLAPAAFFMILVTGIGACFILDPVDLRSFAHSAVAHLFCASNIYFAETMGYFSGAAELYPLLHTWSLSVEEQFYLFAPVVLILVLRFAKKDKEKALLRVLWGVGIASFISCIIVCNNSPSHGFYLSPTRAWEFCAGAILAYVPLREGRISALWSGVIGLFGLILILLSVGFMDAVKYPRAQALLPVFGTVFLIYGLISRPGSLLDRAFAFAPVAWVGLLSYSLYLWHWPFLSLAEHLKSDWPPTLLFLLFALGVVCAVASYYLVEKPFRFQLSKSASLAWIAAIWTVLLISGSAIGLGWVGREPTAVELAHRKNVDWYGKEFRGAGVEIGTQGEKVDFVIWGDSHAGMITGVVDRLAKENQLVGRAYITDTNLPVFGTPQFYPERVDFNNRAMADILTIRPRFCLLVSSWGIYVTDPETMKISREKLKETVEKFNEAGIETLILRQVPLGNGLTGSREVLVAKRFPSLNEVEQWGMTRLEYEDGKDREAEATLFEDSMDLLTILDPGRVFFENEKKRVLLFDETAHYRDVGHLSFSGSERYITPILKPIFHRFGPSRERAN